jgi:hypothetical protein
MLLAMAVLFSAFIVGGISQLRADDWGGHQRYQNQGGFYDGQHHYHDYGHYRGHRGYWNRDSGPAIFINVG